MSRILIDIRRMEDYEKGFNDAELARKWRISETSVSQWRSKRKLPKNLNEPIPQTPSPDKRAQMMRLKNMYAEVEHTLLTVEREYIRVLLSCHFSNKYIANVLDIAEGKVSGHRTALRKKGESIPTSKEVKENAL